MPEDKPLGYIDGKPIFDNAPTVCVLAVLGEMNGERGLIAIRRKNNPGAGKIALPGGYHMRGEPWQMAAVRELEEETGYTVPPDSLIPTILITDEYGNNLIMAVSTADPIKMANHSPDDEVEEVIIVKEGQFLHDQWAFPLHYLHANRTSLSLAFGLAPGVEDLLFTEAQVEEELNNLMDSENNVRPV